MNTPTGRKPSDTPQRQAVINWTPEMLARLKKAHEKAVADKREAFVFEGNDFDTGYAKYLIEYLTSQFPS